MSSAPETVQRSVGEILPGRIPARAVLAHRPSPSRTPGTGRATSPILPHALEAIRARISIEITGATSETTSEIAFPRGMWSTVREATSSDPEEPILAAANDSETISSVIVARAPGWVAIQSISTIVPLTLVVAIIALPMPVILSTVVIGTVTEVMAASDEDSDRASALDPVTAWRGATEDMATAPMVGEVLDTGCMAMVTARSGGD